MPEKKYKRIGWVVETRPDKRYEWRIKKYSFSTTSEEDSIDRYKYSHKIREMAEGNARCVPVYVEVRDA